MCVLRLLACNSIQLRSSGALFFSLLDRCPPLLRLQCLPACLPRAQLFQLDEDEADPEQQVVVKRFKAGEAVQFKRREQPQAQPQPWRQPQPQQSHSHKKQPQPQSSTNTDNLQCCCVRPTSSTHQECLRPAEATFAHLPGPHCAITTLPPALRAWAGGQSGPRTNRTPHLPLPSSSPDPAASACPAWPRSRTWPSFVVGVSARPTYADPPIPVPPALWPPQTPHVREHNQEAAISLDLSENNDHYGHHSLPS